MTDKVKPLSFLAVTTLLAKELGRSLNRYGDLTSPREALRMILKEFEELKDEVEVGREEEACGEAVQLAAMCIKLILAAPKLEWK